MNIGQKIRELRKAKGWKQSDLAERAKCSSSTICEIETRSEVLETLKAIGG